jgi:hypothetical protein
MDYGVPLLLILRPKKEIWQNLSDGEKNDIDSWAKAFCEGPDCKIWSDAESAGQMETIRLYWDSDNEKAIAAFGRARSDIRIKKHYDVFEMKRADE